MQIYYFIISLFMEIDAGMTKNPDFLEQVSSLFGKDDEILVVCLVHYL